MFEFKITGVVQGVGFRPFVYNLAISLGVVGYVQNTGDGVKVLCDDKGFSDSIMKNLPALAKVNSLVVVDSDEEFSGGGFEIRESENVSSYSAIPADLNLCEDCKRELFYENDFRHKYFFISCTNCGPRFSIVKGMPYDRAKTSLDVFEMCDVCRGEYEDPKNRRYHAQTVACKSCGPRLDLYVDGKFFDGDAIEKVILSFLSFPARVYLWKTFYLFIIYNQNLLICLVKPLKSKKAVFGEFRFCFLCLKKSLFFRKPRHIPAQCLLFLVALLLFPLLFLAG